MQVLLLLALVKLSLIGAMGLGLFDGQQAPHPSSFVKKESPKADTLEKVAKAVAPRPAMAEEKEEKAAPKKPARPAPPKKDWAALKAWEARLEQREQRLNVLEQKLKGELKRLGTMEAGIKKMLADAQSVKNKKYKHLVDVYSNMKSTNAAKALEKLDEETAVKVLAGMRGRQAGEILNFVSPGRAARLSERLTNMQIPFN